MIVEEYWQSGLIGMKDRLKKIIFPWIRCPLREDYDIFESFSYFHS